MQPWHLVAEILELQAQLGVPALTGRWPPQARPSPPWCRPGWLGKPQEGFLSSEPWVCSACAVSEARDPGPLSWTDAAVCPTVGPATLSAPDNPCLLGGAASSPSHPLPLSGPASLRLCPHCCAHRNLTTAASRAPGQVSMGGWDCAGGLTAGQVGRPEILAGEIWATHLSVHREGLCCTDRSVFVT